MLPKDQICDSMSEESLIDPEDGIVDAVDRQLVVGHPSVETWEEIWRAVFPGDEDIPAPGKSDVSGRVPSTHANPGNRLSSHRGAC